MKGHKENPWLGLRSYQEGEIIYGRAEDIERLSQCVLSHIQTVLYGRSGIGKTSILNAGIFPLARKKGLFPVSVRLDHNANAQPYATQISKAVLSGINRLRKDSYDENGVLSTSFNKGVVHERVKAIGSKESLWEFFHRHEFYDADGQRIKPLIVLDQFEEVFTLGKDKDKVRVLFSELADLLNGVVPDYINKVFDEQEPDSQNHTDSVQEGVNSDLVDFNSLQESYNNYLESSDFHLIITLREDFLSYLERECNQIPALRQNRFCLQPINENQAAVIIMNPVRGLVKQSVAELIIKKVTGESNVDLDGIPTISVDSAILSLYLQRLFDRLGDDDTEISASLVESEAENIISGFYLEAISDIPEDIVEYLEDTLVNEEGCRENISVYSARKNIWALLQKNPSSTKDEVTSTLNKLIDDRRLLRRFDYGGGLRIELIHDILCPVIVKRKEQRAIIKRQELLEEEHRQEAQRLEEEKRRLEWEKEREAQRLDLEKKRLFSIKSRNRKVAALLASAALFLCIVAMVIAMMGVRNKRQAKELQALNTEISTIMPSVIEQKILDGDSYMAGSLLLRLFPDSLYKYGDPLRTSMLRKLSHVHSILLQGHAQSVNTVQFSPDDRYAITGSNDMTLRLWDAKTGDLLSSSSEGRSAVLSASWNHDGSKVVYSSKDGLVRTCTIQEGVLHPLDSLDLKDSYARFVSFNPAGTEIVACCYNGPVLVLDVEHLRVKETIPASKSGATYASYSPDGGYLAIAMASNKSIVIKRVSDMSTITTLTGHTDWVRSVEFSPDGKMLVSCSDDRSVRTWDLESNRSLRLAVLPDWGTKAAFTPDGGRVVCSSRDGILRIYDLRTANEIPEFQIKHTGYLNSFDITSNGGQVICGSTDPIVHVWDCGDSMDTGTAIHMDGAVYEFSCFAEPARIAAATNKGMLGVWDMRDKIALSLKSIGAGDQGRVETLAVSPDGNLIALATRFKVRLFSGKDGEELDIDNQGGHHAWVRSLRFSHDGTMLASVGEDGRIIIWDIAQKRIQKTVNSGSVGLYSVSFSHDDQTLITGDTNGVIRRWNVATGDPIGDSIIGHTGVVLSVQFNHDDSMILASSGDQTASIWKLDGSLVRRFVGASGYMQDAIFSQDEDEIITASADRYIRIWCVSSGEETARLVGHFGAVSHLEWAGNGMLVSSDMLGEIRVWNVPDLKSVANSLNSSDISF